MAADAQVPARPAPSRRGSGGGARLRLRLRRLGRGATPFLLLAPAAALIGWLLIYPAVEAVQLSFTSWDGFSAPVSV
ncbi:MAG: sugar ABC transporter permease, partial [Actinobacteria bacterium]|nr:sugar ABC transporter permease [Actinomycetota bacterium]